MVSDTLCPALYNLRTGNVAGAWGGDLRGLRGWGPEALESWGLGRLEPWRGRNGYILVCTDVSTFVHTDVCMDRCTDGNSLL